MVFKPIPQIHTYIRVCVYIYISTKCKNVWYLYIFLCGFEHYIIQHLVPVDMAKRVRLVWPDPFDPQPVWPVTRLTRLKMTRFDPWPVLTRDPFDPTRTRPDPPVLPCLPMMSKLRLRCNFYKIFTYSSLLNMLCTLL